MCLLWSYPYNMGTFFGNRHCCLCIWDTRQYQSFEITDFNSTSYPIIKPKMKKFLPVVTEIRVRMDGWTHRHTRPMTICTTGINQWAIPMVLTSHTKCTHHVAIPKSSYHSISHGMQIDYVKTHPCFFLANNG